jgi:hypothetical protein
LGERLLCKQEVIGSIPFTSTTGAVRRWPSTFGEEQERYRPGMTRGGMLFEG